MKIITFYSLVAIVALSSSLSASEFVYRSPLDGVKASQSEDQQPSPSGNTNDVCYLEFKNLTSSFQYYPALNKISPVLSSGEDFNFGLLNTKSGKYADFDNAEVEALNVYTGFNVSNGIKGYESGGGMNSYWMGYGKPTELSIRFKSPVDLKGVSYNDLPYAYSGTFRGTKPPYDIVLSDCSGSVLKTINITEQKYETTINFSDY